MYLTQNKEMKADRVWNFTLPAWVIELPDGSHFNVCRNAGVCAKFCYARNGTYLFPKVKGKHLSNLTLVRDDPNWVGEIAVELEHKRFKPLGEPRVVPGLTATSHLSQSVRDWLEVGGQAVRIHDSGDFFSEEYLGGWITLADRFPQILFYAYTKEVELFESSVLPDNFLYVYSLGGKQDNLVDKSTMRHADVFPEVEDIIEAGYVSQHESDLLCVLLPSLKIGVPQNNIKHFKKRLAGRTFSQAESESKRH